MKRVMMWLLAIGICVPACLTLAADGEPRGKGDRSFDLIPLLGKVSLTQDQREKLTQLKKDHDARIKEINEDFAAAVMAVLTPDQVDQLKELRKDQAERRNAEGERGGKERRHEASSEPSAKARDGGRGEDSRNLDKEDRLIQEIEQLHQELKELRHEVKGLEKEKSQ